jgi:L-rhamnose mutarotase
MERLGLCYRAVPEKKQEYLRAHREIWPQIVKGLADAGCREMSIFLRGNMFFIYALIDDIAEFNRIRDRDPWYHKWDAWMHELLESPYDGEEEGPFAALEEVWRFEDGRVVLG